MIELRNDTTNFIEVKSFSSVKIINRREVRSIASKLVKEIEERLKKCGVYYRITWRVKEDASLRKKLKKKEKEKNDYKIQDLIGIRIVTFFGDDVETLSEHLMSDFRVEKQKKNEKSEVNPYFIKNNYTYKIPEAWFEQYEIAVQHPNIDNTFELQIRSINSEAWQELDHDYVYKLPDGNDKRQLQNYFKAVGCSYKCLEENVITFYDNMAELAKEQQNLVNFIRYKFRIKIKDLEKVEQIQKENPEIDFMELIENSDRKQVLGCFFEATLQDVIDINDLLNICLKLVCKETIFSNSNNYFPLFMKDFAGRIKGYNPKLGTIHDKEYDDYLEFRDEVMKNLTKIEFEDSDD